MGTNALNDRRAGLDVALTNLSIGIPTDQDYIGDQILPTLRIPLSTVKMPVWGTEAFRIREDRVGDFSEPDKLDVSLDTTTVEVDGHSFMGPVSRRQQKESMSGPFQIDLDFEVLQAIKAVMALAREKMIADLLTSTTPYGATFKQDQNGLTRLWSDNTIDPLDDLIPMMESTIPLAAGKRPNVLWMGQPVWAALQQNTIMKNRIYGEGSPQGVLKVAQFADLIGIEKVLVGRAVSKTPGGVNTQLWGKNAGLAYVPPTTGRRVPATGYVVEETVFGAATEKVFRFPDEKMGASGGDWIKRSHFYTPVLVFSGSSSLFYNAVA